MLWLASKEFRVGTADVGRTLPTIHQRQSQSPVVKCRGYGKRLESRVGR